MVQILGQVYRPIREFFWRIYTYFHCNLEYNNKEFSWWMIYHIICISTIYEVCRINKKTAANNVIICNILLSPSTHFFAISINICHFDIYLLSDGSHAQKCATWLTIVSQTKDCGLATWPDTESRVVHIHHIPAHCY